LSRRSETTSGFVDQGFGGESPRNLRRRRPEENMWRGGGKVLSTPRFKICCRAGGNPSPEGDALQGKKRSKRERKKTTERGSRGEALNFGDSLDPEN